MKGRTATRERGRVESVTLLRSTAPYNYDRTIERGIREWRYRSLFVEGTPVTAGTGGRGHRWPKVAL